MSYFEKHNPAIEGSTESPNLTIIQKKYVEVLTILDRVANTVGLRRGVFWSEAPNGFSRMLEAIKNDGKNIDTMKPEEVEEYEKQYRYERISGQRLGNSALILQYLVHLAHEDKEVKKMADEFITEAKVIASKVTSEYVRGEKAHGNTK